MQNISDDFHKKYFAQETFQPVFIRIREAVVEKENYIYFNKIVSYFRHSSKLVKSFLNFILIFLRQIRLHTFTRRTCKFRDPLPTFKLSAKWPRINIMRIFDILL